MDSVVGRLLPTGSGSGFVRSPRSRAAPGWSRTTFPVPAQRWARKQHPDGTPTVAMGCVRRLRFDVPPRAAVSPLLNQGDDTLGGGEQATMEAPIYDVASSCLVCGVEFFDVGHRTSRRGVELFDVASNFSTWHRTFRRGVEMFDVGHRNVAGECPLTSNIPTFPHRRIRQRSHSCCAAVLLGRYRKTLSGMASLSRWGRRSSGFEQAERLAL